MSLGLLLVNDLFDDAIDVSEKIDEFFDNFTNGISWFEPLFSPSTEFVETKDSYKIIMDLPGVKKKNLKIISDTTSLEIRLTDESKMDRVKAFLHLKERSEGLLTRKINFQNYIEPSKAIINLENGILSIEIPKIQKSNRLTLKVE